jgi:cell division protein FtsI (penicillin-binding protein 3)
VNSYGLNKKLNMDFEGKATCYSATSDKNWSNISFLDGLRLWVSVTPMQTLAFYNAVANNGVLVKLIVE